MNSKIVLIVFFLLIVAALSAQYDEKTIMFQNAQQLTFQRDYAAAEQAWLQILQKYPNDLSAITQLFQLYLLINKQDKAEKLVADYRSVLPDNLRMEYEIQIDINQARLKEAWDKTQSYIQLNPQDENRYRVLAGFYERKGFYEQEIRLYEQGRAAIGKPYYYQLEIGNAAFYGHMYEKAISEYIGFIQYQPGNVYFISNQMGIMLKENPDLISNLRKLAQASSNLEVKEVYAIALSRMERYNEALAVYASLPTEKLTNFANEQFAAGRDSLAIVAYNNLMHREIDVITLGDIMLKTAEAHIHLHQYAQADSVLSAIVDPAAHNANSPLFKKRFPFQAYLTLADLALWQKKSNAAVTSYLNEARKIAATPDEFQEVDFRLANNYFINGQYTQAEQMLQNLNQSTQKDRQYYYAFLLAMAQAQPEKADTLLNELIIADPGSKYVNDLMTLNIVLMNLAPKAQTGFMDAYRYRLSHQDSLAINTVLNLSNTSNDEELRILAADWAEMSGLTKWAISIYTFAWQDELLKEYAALQISRLQTSISSAESMAQDFLKTNPNSVFSPGFRQILQKAPNSRPSL